MIGTIVNTCTIIVGSIVGAAMNRGIKEKYIVYRIGIGLFGHRSQCGDQQFQQERISGAVHRIDCHRKCGRYRTEPRRTIRQPHQQTLKKQ